MSDTTTLNKIKSFLGLEVKLDTLKTVKGTVFEAESFEAGAAVFVLGEDEPIPVPPADYEMEDGQILSVVEEGVIASIGQPSEEETVEEEMEEEKPKKVVESVSKETHFEMEKETKSEDTVEEVILSQPYIDAIAQVVKEEFAKLTQKEEETKEEVKEELSAVTEPIKHSPESKKENKPQVTFAQNRPETTKDRVFKNLWS